MINKETIKNIITEFWERDLSPMERDINQHLEIDKVVTIIGSRRSGKTYFLFSIIKDLLKNGVNQSDILYFNFEDERILGFDNLDFASLLEAWEELFVSQINIKHKRYLFFDEIQEIKGWEKFIRRLSEMKKYKIYLTGSSSKLLSKEIHTVLRGRSLSQKIYPFSFKEFLKYKNVIFTQEKNKYGAGKLKIKTAFLNYLKFGGFPEVININDDEKIIILQNYYEMIFYKDLVDRYEIRNLHLMKSLMKHLIDNFTHKFAVNNYFNLLKKSGLKIGKDSLFNYFDYLEDVNFIINIPFFSFSSRQQLVNPKKVYLIDNGLITSSSFQFSSNKGSYLENIVLIELARRNYEIYYFNNKSECDFVVQKSGSRKFQAIQVCWELNEQNRNREITGLVQVLKEMKLKNGLILTMEQEDEFCIDKKNVRIQPVWKWLIK